MSSPIVKVLITLDSLFDTRLGVLKSYNPNLVIPVLQNSYLKRISNRLSLLEPTIDDNKIKEIWENRDISILKKSELTMIIYYLMDDTVNTIGIKDEFPDAVKLDITINTYPYKLSNELWIKLRDTLKKQLNVETLNSIYMSLDKLTLPYLNSNFKNFIVHDINEWSQYHQKSLMTPIKNNSMDRLTITAPIILGDNVDLSEINDNFLLNIQRAEKLAFSSFFFTDLRPLQDFSIALNDNTELGK